MKNLLFAFAVLLQSAVSFAQTGKNSEFFLEIADRGKFTVYLDEEFSGSVQGRFRFFDLDTRSSPTLTILQNNRTVFRQRINLENNTRIIASYSDRRGFRIVKTLPILRNRQYLLDDWDGSQNMGPAYPPDRPEYPDNVYTMPEPEFNRLLNDVKKEGFDPGKSNLIQVCFKNNWLVTTQVFQLLKTITFDEERLRLAKMAYRVTYDKNNFYTLKESFSFLNGKEDFMAFVSSLPPNR
ncbi:DUF4476 domain-containing protein [Pedobacter nutrimenti]|uniref:Uncharacterized protein DUF4476 n=1 Tax=Pedobacter nutrimenti TaxID=1241337 RepID=A0A318UHN2_9SPHI|nr:DUF4476 domain-containing protein [Pedobacter nutrimenti]PYF75521.1 uncharacterized protein DUF4476 [Pedobacter nutrimenti]